MELFAMGRNTGKTTQAIYRASLTGGYLVVRSHAEAHRCAKEAERLGLSIPFPLTFDEFVAGRFHGPGINGGFVVDGADALLEWLARGVPVHAATFTLTPLRSVEE